MLDSPHEVQVDLHGRTYDLTDADDLNMLRRIVNYDQKSGFAPKRNELKELLLDVLLVGNFPYRGESEAAGVPELLTERKRLRSELETIRRLFKETDDEEIYPGAVDWHHTASRMETVAHRAIAGVQP